MKDLKAFNISFVGLKLGKHQFDYQVDKEFFDFFQYDEFKTIVVKVDLDFEKKSNMFKLLFLARGKATVNCDISNEPFEVPIKAKLPLIVKFGEEYNDDDDEILIIPHNEYQLNVAQLIYEMIVLSLPIKRVHPGIKDGTLKSDILNKLEDYQDTKEKTLDPRWAKLKEIQSNKKE